MVTCYSFPSFLIKAFNALEQLEYLVQFLKVHLLMKWSRLFICLVLQSKTLEITKNVIKHEIRKLLYIKRYLIDLTPKFPSSFQTYKITRHEAQLKLLYTQAGQEKWDVLFPCQANLLSKINSVVFIDSSYSLEGRVT